MPLPACPDLTSLVLRTDFSDESSWNALRAALDATCEFSDATYVNDDRFSDTSVQTLVDEEAAAEDDERVCYVFLADRTALADPSHPLLAVDLSDEPGRTFRVPARWFPDVSANLSISNMDFAEFADSADDTGTFHGFGDA